MLQVVSTIFLDLVDFLGDAELNDGFYGAIKDRDCEVLVRFRVISTVLKLSELETIKW